MPILRYLALGDLYHRRKREGSSNGQINLPP
jgi:hypothetical protein